LAESYYQSLLCPFQTLIVGDPLCRPWAKIPKVTLDGVTPGGEISGPIELTPRVSGSTNGGSPDRFQFFVDGLRVGLARAGDSFALDTSVLPDGYHELRVVAIENSTIETQGRAIVPILTKNHGRTLELRTVPADRVRWGEKLTIAARSPGAKSIRIQRDGALIEEIQGEEGSIEIDPQTLGYGPVRLNAVVFGETAADQVVSSPVRVQIQPSNPLPAQQIDVPSLSEGLKLTVDGQAPTVIADTTSADWLARNGVGPRQAFTLSGVFQATQPDIFQFHLRFVGSMTVKVDGQLLEEFTSEQPYTRMIPVVLAAGAHQIELSGVTGDHPKLDALFGNQGATPMMAPMFRYE
jgi:hypothetical protein